MVLTLRLETLINAIIIITIKYGLDKLKAYFQDVSKGNFFGFNTSLYYLGNSLSNLAFMSQYRFKSRLYISIWKILFGSLPTAVCVCGLFFFLSLWKAATQIPTTDRHRHTLSHTRTLSHREGQLTHTARDRYTNTWAGFCCGRGLSSRKACYEHATKNVPSLSSAARRGADGGWRMGGY